jgi:hypothetical protein
MRTAAWIRFHHREGSFASRSTKRVKEIDFVMKYWEIIADRLSKAGWSLGWVSAIDSQGRTIWIVDARRGAGRQFIVQADEKLTPFLVLSRRVEPIDNGCKED